MIYDGTGSVKGATGLYLVVLGQYGAVLFGTWWYLVSISWYCLVLGGTGSAKGLYACIYWKKWRFGRVLPMPHTHTYKHSQQKIVPQGHQILMKLSYFNQNKKLLPAIL